MIFIVDDYLDKQETQQESPEDDFGIDLEKQTDIDRIAYFLAKNGVKCNQAFLEMLRKEHQDHSEKKSADNEEFEIGSDFVDCDLDAAYGI